jgi:hypothetical protein
MACIVNLKGYRKKVPTPQKLALFAFDEYRRFDTSALFGGIK